MHDEEEVHINMDQQEIMVCYSPYTHEFKELMMLKLFLCRLQQRIDKIVDTKIKRDIINLQKIYQS